MGGFICTPSDMHPYNCEWNKYCEHCTNAKTEWHDPTKCWLCCDGDPKTNKPMRLVEDDFAIKIRVYDFSHRYQKVKVKNITQLQLLASTRKDKNG